MENLKIKHFWYNAFIIQNDKVKIAIDPGQNLYLLKLGSLIPKSEWSSITHILITHGDPDHYWQADRVAEAARAPVICGKELAKEVGAETLLVAPCGRDIKYEDFFTQLQVQAQEAGLGLWATLPPSGY